jgi:Zn-dependent M28 family amino/carboxypeptidase
MIGRGRTPGTPLPPGPLPLTDTESLYVVGSKRLSSELGTIVADVNARYHRLHLDYSLDDPANPGKIYERSDHYQYAKRGIPVAFFFTGVHADYHGLDDEIDRIDFTKLRRITQTIYAAARAIADGPRRPAVEGVTR